MACRESLQGELKRRCWQVLLLVWGAQASGGEGQQHPRAPDAQLDEVQVIGTRAHLSELRKTITALEDRFYTRYNELNTEDDFDIHCEIEAKTGVRLKLRSCRARYQIAAFAEEGRDAFEIRQNIQDQIRREVPVQMPRSPPTHSTMEILRRQEDFRRNMRRVSARDPQLVEILKQRAEALDRYDAARRKFFGRSARNSRETPLQHAAP